MQLMLGVVSLMLAATFATPATQQTGQEIIARSIEARGGAAALRARETVRMTATMLIPQDGAEYRMVLLRKRPNFYRSEVEFEGEKMIRATDGRDAWWVNPSADVFEPSPMPAEMAASFIRQSDIDTSLAGFLPAGSEATFLDRTLVEGVEYLRVRITHPDGGEIINYYDSSTYLVGRTVRSQRDEEGEFEVVTVLSDYREVEGVLYSYRSERLVDGQTTRITTWTAFEPNVEMGDELFRQPR